MADTVTKFAVDAPDVLPGLEDWLRAMDQTHDDEPGEPSSRSLERQAAHDFACRLADELRILVSALPSASDDFGPNAVRYPLDGTVVDLIRQAAQHGVATLRQLHSISRRSTIEPVVCELNEAVEATRPTIERLLGSRVNLQLQLDDKANHVSIDPASIDHVLINLAFCTAYALRQGGLLTLTTGHDLRLETERFERGLVPPGHYGRLTVRFSGGVVPPAELERLFEPFPNIKAGRCQTLLGLPTMHSVVSYHGGYIEVRNRPQEGVRFELLLPRRETSALRQLIVAPNAPLTPRVYTGRTLLLVLNDWKIRNLATDLLTREGLQVFAAGCSEDAVELILAGDLASSFACVISDLTMSGMSGPDLVRSLRIFSPTLPAILTSSDGNIEMCHKMRSENFYFLPKLFTAADLSAEVNNILGRPSRAVQELGRYHCRPTSY